MLPSEMFFLLQQTVVSELQLHRWSNVHTCCVSIPVITTDIIDMTPTEEMYTFDIFIVFETAKILKNK